MNLRSNVIIATSLFVIFIIFEVIATANAIETNSAKDTVEKFCNAEFIGVQDIRLEMVHYSKKIKKLEGKNDPEFKGLVKYWEHDPVVLVESYHIISVSVKRDHAVASIQYKLLARTKGNGVLNRELIAVSNKSEIVNLHLVYDGLKWSVVNPPVPRVSIQAIISYHKKIYEIMGNDWLEKTNVSKEQKQYYRKIQENIKILSKLQEDGK